jgi:hypothetical protein
MEMSMKMKPPHAQQLDLFAQLARPITLSREDQQEAVTLLRVLLLEAAGAPSAASKVTSPREASDDQDYV